MVKTVLIVDVDNHFDKANSEIKKLMIKKPLILYLSNEIADTSNYIIADDLFSEDYFFKLDKEVRKLMNSWYKPVENQLKYFDISLGELVNLEFMKIWPVLFKIDAILKMIEKEKPEEIFLVTEYNEDIKILNETIKSKKIKFSYKKFNVKLLKKKNKYKLLAKLQNLYFKINIARISKKNKILFIGNLRQSLPIFKELKKNKNNIIIRAGENPGRGFLNRYFDYYITFSEFSGEKLNKKIRKIRKEFNVKWNLIKNNKKFRDRIFYKIKLFNIIEKDLEYIILNRFISLIKYIEIMKLLKNKIDIVVTQNDLIPFERTLVKTANKFNIPTLTTIDGILSDHIIKRKETDFLPPSSQRMALFSDHQKEIILKEFKEISRDRLAVTGFPVFDLYYNDKPSLNREELCKLLKIDEKNKIILYIAEQYSTSRKECSLLGLLTKKQHKKRYKELFRMIREVDNLYLIIKPHPSGSLEDSFIKDIASKINVKKFIIVRDVDIYSLVNASEVIITRLSTVGLEAMILKKPVIIFDTYSNTLDYFNYREFGAALHAKKQGELINMVKNLLKNKTMQEKLQAGMIRFINKHYNKDDGRSACRFACLIENIIENKNKRKSL